MDKPLSSLTRRRSQVRVLFRPLIDSREAGTRPPGMVVRLFKCLNVMGGRLLCSKFIDVFVIYLISHSLCGLNSFEDEKNIIGIFKFLQRDKFITIRTKVVHHSK
jgi:hypothetical protein